ncbi:MAG: hypothetical protein KGN84_20220, partial [Acidobacteriota bacterium]|nr:hypothetical protein [Acidobacteriota bacterium]
MPKRSQPGYDDVMPVRSWQILSGLAVSGFLLALPGGLLPLWGYHVSGAFGVAGNYFLALGAGLTCGSVLAVKLRAKYALEQLLATGCFAGALVLLLLTFAQPPASPWYQAFVLLVAGAASGTINRTVFETLAPAYEANRAGVMLSAGGFFGAGSFLSAYLLADCLDSSSPARWFAVAAVALAGAGFLLGRLRLAVAAVNVLPAGEATRDLRSVLAILFALLRV